MTFHSVSLTMVSKNELRQERMQGQCVWDEEELFLNCNHHLTVGEERLKQMSPWHEESQLSPGNTKCVNCYSKACPPASCPLFLSLLPSLFFPTPRPMYVYTRVQEHAPRHSCVQKRTLSIRILFYLFLPIPLRQGLVLNLGLTFCRLG